jgi:hypothetical protein
MAATETSPHQSGVNSTFDAEDIDLPAYLDALHQLLDMEEKSSLGRLPVIGIVARAGIRLKNMRHFWYLSSVIALTLTQRQAALSEQLDSLLKQAGTDV